MFSKLVSLAALVAVASAASHAGGGNPEIMAVRDDLVINLPAGKTVAFERDGSQSMDLENNGAAAAASIETTEELAAAISTLTVTTENMEKAIETTGEAIQGVAAMAANVSEVQDTLDEVDDLYKTDVHKLNKHFTDDLEDAHGESDELIDATLKEITAELKKVQQDLDKNVKAAIEDAVEATDALAERNAVQIQRLDDYEKCAAAGQLFDTKKKECKDAIVPPEKFLNKISYRVFTNEDGRDGGYISNRYLTVDKQADDSYLRVFYQDNMRTHGHDTHASWNIMFCDGNGNGCGRCSDPANLRHARRNLQQHGWWTNDYVGGGVTGICKRSESRALNKGKHMLKIYMDWNRYDISTGSNGGGNFMVDEVVKY
jgi:hypothetical protein